MNIGFLFSILAGFVWSLVNVVDKTVVSKFIRNPIFIIIVFCITSLVIGLITLPFLQFDLHGWAWGWLFISSFSYTLANLLYYYALKRDEPSRIIPLFSLSAIFLVFLSAIFLGEIFNFKTYLGIFIIIAGSVIITMRKNIRGAFASKSLWLMVLSCFGFAVVAVINKYLLNSYSYWQIFGFQRVIVGLIGIFFIIFFFSNIKQSYQQIKKKYIILNSLAETMNLLGALLFLVAISFWYVTLANTIVSVQYVFVFLWALIISRFKPSLFSEEVSRQVIFQKIAAIILIIGGVFLIS